MRISVDFDNHSVQESSTMAVEAVLLANVIRGIGNHLAFSRNWNMNDIWNSSSLPNSSVAICD